MPIEWTRDKETGITSFTVSGSLTPSEVRESLGELYADPDPDVRKRYLFDLREATIDWHSDSVRELAHWVGANRPPGEGRTAILVAYDLHFGLARMYEMLSSDVPVEIVVFRDLEAATVWLAR